MLKQMARGRVQTRLSHEEVAERMVDYHFGRLSPAMNRAIETHIRSCPRCKAEGLRSAASEREASGRRLRRVRGGKPLIGPRGRITLLALAVLIIAQTVLLQVTRGQAQPLVSLLGQWHAQGVGPVLGLDSVNISPSGRFSGDTGDASAIALSLDGKTLAVSQSSPKPSVTLWNAQNGDRIAALPWSGAGVAAAFAWSADGASLAAATSTTVVVWVVSSRKVVASFPLSDTAGAQIFDVRQQAVIASPDAAALFAGGPLVWGADGALTTAPPGAVGPTGVTSPQTPVAGFWSSAGAHLFGDGQGSVRIGVSDSDAQLGESMLDWSPDGRYLLWASVSIAVTGASAVAADAAPDGVVQAVVARVQATSAAASSPGVDDALLWFAPDGRHIAVCDRTRPGSHAQIYDIASGTVTATLQTACASLPAHAAQWATSGGLFYIVPNNGPVAVYTIPLT